MSPTRLFSAVALAALLATPALAQGPASTAAPAATAMAKPVAAQGDLLDTLKLNGQFTTFVKAVDSTNLSTLLKTNTNLTVFAPTDAAFAAMPAADLAKLMADKPGLQKFVTHHLINAPVPGPKIKGTKGQWPAVSGDKILLDGSDEATLKADGATIVQADVKTSSGLLHIVDHVLIAGQGDPTMPAATPAVDASASAKP